MRAHLEAGRRRARLGAAVVALAALLGACGGETTEGTARAATDVRVVSPADAWEAMRGGEPRVVIDVRTPAEYAQGHLPGAVSIDLSASDFRQRIGALDRADAYVVYCRSGNRSAEAGRIMRDLGFTKIYDVSGGILAWQAAGLPVIGG